MAYNDKVVDVTVNLGTQPITTEGFEGKLGETRVRLFDENLYAYIASDAHRVEHYGYFAEAKRTYRTRGAHARL